MATVLDRVDLAEIRAQASDIQFSRTVLTVLAAVFVAIGWLAYQPWKAIAWSFAAVKVGWRLAQQPRTRPPDGPA